MAYFRKNVNILLLLLIIIILGIFAGFTTYYQTTYKNLSLSYSEKLNQLNQLNYNISAQKSQLRQMNEDLMIKSAVKEKFDVLYSNVTEYNQQLAQELDRTKKELIGSIEDLKSTRAELETKKSELGTVKGALKTQQEYSLELETKNNQLRVQVCNLKEQLNQTC